MRESDYYTDNLDLRCTLSTHRSQSDSCDLGVVEYKYNDRLILPPKQLFLTLLAGQSVAQSSVVRSLAQVAVSLISEVKSRPALRLALTSSLCFSVAVSGLSHGYTSMGLLRECSKLLKIPPTTIKNLKTLQCAILTIHGIVKPILSLDAQRLICLYLYVFDTF
jgi:hypothetical protein